MSEAKFTPGPWTLAKDCSQSAIDLGLTIIVESVSEESHVAFVFDDKPGDAAMIAAAPELLAACQAWVDYFDELTRDDEPGDRLAEIRRRFHQERVDATRAAIVKATGAASKEKESVHP